MGPVVETGMPMLGVMQGRLSPRPPQAPPQTFPWKTWEAEFHHAKALRVDSIEWLVTADRTSDNPIRHSAGRARIRQLIAETGVRVLSVCADYFIAHPFFRVTPAERSKSVSLLMGLIGEARAVGAATVLIPVLEAAQINSQAERDELIAALHEPLWLARSMNVRLGLETELPASEQLNLIGKFDHEHARIYYDAGNAAARGYDIALDVRLLAKYLCGVHAKDRMLGGGSVQLGRGAANFPAFFEALRETRYTGPIVLETPIQTDYANDARGNLDFVRRHLAGAAQR